MGDGSHVFKCRVSGRKVKVIHIDDYGVLVRNVMSVDDARKALKKAGYPKGLRRSMPHRPLMVDQEDPVGYGSPWGGTPAIAFYFEVGPFA